MSSVAKEQDLAGRILSWLRRVSIGALVMLGGACVSQAAVAPTPTPVKLNSAEQVQILLAEAAGNSRLGARIGRAPPETEGREVWVDGERISVYQLLGSAPASSTVSQLQSEGAARIWVLDPLIVTYAGSDGGTVLLLSAVLGDPAIGPLSSGGEPYPPAVSAAIGVVAEMAAIGPDQVEVLSYHRSSWSDGCLGLPDSGESCSPERVEGWIIRLRARGEDFQLHSDQLGGEVRVR